MKSAAKSSRIQSNLMNDEELRSFNFLELKYRKGGGGGGANSIVFCHRFSTVFNEFINTPWIQLMGRNLLSV